MPPEFHLRLALLGALGFGLVAMADAAVVQDEDGFGNIDGRGPITEKAEQLGLSAAEVDRLRAATGYVVCPGAEHRNGIVASAAVVASAQVVVTVGHAFVDEAGLPRTPIEDCVFRNQAAPPAEIRLAGGDALWVGLAGAADPHDPSDYAVAVLALPVAGATPLSVVETLLKPGARVIGIVAWQQIEGRALDPDVPVAQDCAVREIDDGNGARPANYLTDCDLGPGGSGGHILTRVGDELATAGVFSTSGGPRSEGRSFSRRLGSYTRVVAIDGGFALAVERALDTLDLRPP